MTGENQWKAAATEQAARQAYLEYRAGNNRGRHSKHPYLLPPWEQLAPVARASWERLVQKQYRAAA